MLRVIILRKAPGQCNVSLRMLLLHAHLLGRYLEYLNNYPVYISIIPFPAPHVVKPQHTTGQQP